MSAVSIVEDAERAGVRLSADGANLVVIADREPSPELIECLRHHKPDILALLRANAEAHAVIGSQDELTAALAEACRGTGISPDDAMTELALEDLEDWRMGDYPLSALGAFVRALAASRMRDRGEVPRSYTATTVCRHCGPVPIWEGTPESVEGCPWCFNRVQGLPMPKGERP